MKGEFGSRITNYFTKFYMKYTNTILLNKNLLLSGSVGLTSTLTVISGFISSKVIFVVLFHLDNKKKYTKKLTGKLNVAILKQIVTKMIFADSVFDIINNVSRFFILLELLRIEYQPVQAAIIASIIGSCFSYLAINLIVRRMHVFRFRKKLF